MKITIKKYLKKQLFIIAILSIALTQSLPAMDARHWQEMSFCEKADHCFRSIMTSLCCSRPFVCTKPCPQTKKHTPFVNKCCMRVDESDDEEEIEEDRSIPIPPDLLKIIRQLDQAVELSPQVEQFFNQYEKTAERVAKGSRSREACLVPPDAFLVKKDFYDDYEKEKPEDLKALAEAHNIELAYSQEEMYEKFAIIRRKIHEGVDQEIENRGGFVSEAEHEEISRSVRKRHSPIVYLVQEDTPSLRSILKRHGLLKKNYEN